MSKDTRIAFRTSIHKKERLQRAAEMVGLTETTLAEACIEALVRYIEEHGEIRLPLSVIPTVELKKREAKSDRLSFSTVRHLEPPPTDQCLLNEEYSTDSVTPVPLPHVRYTKAKQPGKPRKGK